MHFLWIALPFLAAVTNDRGPVTDRPAIAAAAHVQTAQAEQQPNSPPTASWPSFRGRDRDGVYRGSIRTSWEGLTPLWKKPVGGGHASFVVAGTRAFTIEQRQRSEVVAAYDVLTGKELWTSAWPERFTQWMGGGEGPRATPAWADGFVFALGARGELRCLDAESGKLIWRTNILQDAGAKNLRWGMAASPLVAGDAVIVLPGGAAGRSVAAYDRRTGKRLWTALDDKQAYVAPMQITLLGVPQFLVVTAKRIVGLGVDRHDVLWEFPWTTDHDASAAQPIVIGDNRVFYSSGYGTGAAVVELTKDGERFAVREVWRSKRMKNRQSSSVLHDGFIYGLDEGILACVDASTGELKWKGGRYGHGQVLLAGNHLVITTEEGALVLVAASPEKLQEVAQLPAVEGRTWNVPAFADGILLVRNAEEMTAFDLRPRPSGSGPSQPDASGPNVPDPVVVQPLSDPVVVQPFRAVFVVQPFRAVAQPFRAAGQSTSAAQAGREWYVSWGYNGDSYAKSDLHITQPPLGNDFTLVAVRARDSKAWTDLFNHGLTVPQYNVRVGVFLNDKWGVELAIDHIKWIVRQDQTVRMTGTLNGAAVDTEVTLTPDVLRYQLNNGANPVSINVLRRIRLRGERGRTGSISFVAKAGGGFAIPHTENVLFGEPNEKGFQFFRGWNLDAVAAIRLHLFRGLYFEFEEKGLYARYFGLNVDRGEARHSVKAAEFTLNFGWAFR